MTSTNSGAGKTVLVTGASGFVGAEVLNSLLSRGYNVKATVRNDSSADKIKKSHSKYVDQLSFAIVKDVQTPGGHDEAVKGVDGVSDESKHLVNSANKYRSSILLPHSSWRSKTMQLIFSILPSTEPWSF